MKTAAAASASMKNIGEALEKWWKRKKGHFAVYSKEGKRFFVPLYYLNHPIFKVLLEMAEEEFGCENHGPLQVPCEEELMDYFLSLLRKTPETLDKANSASMATCRGASFSPLITLFYAHGQGGERPSMVL